MISTKLEWHGEKCKQFIVSAAWDGIVRATVFLWNTLQTVLGVANTGTRVKDDRGKGATVYLNPSKPGEPPHKVTGWGQRHVKYELDKPNLRSRVGLADNAKYMLTHELGGSSSYDIVPTQAKALRFWSTSLGKFIFRKRVKHGPAQKRPWFLVTVKKVWPQLEALVGPVE